MKDFLQVLIGVVMLADLWLIYKKMGRAGWEGIIPFYNVYVLFEVLYGSGWKALKLLIPIYNIYVAVKMYIDWAHEFRRSSGFGVGMLLLPAVFYTILAFGNDPFRGGIYANTSRDCVQDAADYIKEKVASTMEPKKDCPVCGEKVDAADEFCPNCGKRFEAPERRFCTNCGNELKEGENFCPKCGKKAE